MPVVRQPVSLSQLADLLGVEPWRLLAVEVDLSRKSAALVLEPDDRDPEEGH